MKERRLDYSLSLYYYMSHDRTIITQSRTSNSIGLISAAAIGGYAVGEHGNSHDAAIPKPNAVASASPASSSKNAIKPGDKKVTITPSATPKPTVKPSTTSVLKKADMQPPLLPTGGEYNTAAQAVANVYGGGDVVSGESLLKSINSPELKAQTTHAFQEAIAAQAMSDVYGGGDVASGEALLQKVTLSDIKPKAQEAVSTAIAAQAASDAYGGGDIASARALEAKITDPKLVSQVETMIHEVQTHDDTGASNTYDQLGTEASNQYDSIGQPIASEYEELNRHTDAYLKQYNEAK